VAFLHRPAGLDCLRRHPLDHQLDLAPTAGLTMVFGRHDQQPRADRHWDDSSVASIVFGPRSIPFGLSGDGLGLAPILRLFGVFELVCCALVLTDSLFLRPIVDAGTSPPSAPI